LTVVVGESEKVKEKIKALAADCKADKFGIMAVGSVELYGNFAVINMGTNAQEVAANLFDLLRRCDEIGLEEVFVEGVSEEGLGAAIMNRLKKAASYNILEV
jgi:L-threonylcarbamoyladenylate synthase